jgi:sporulation delaying protein B
VFGVDRALAFEPRSTALAAGRSLVAVAQVTAIGFTADADLFPSVPNEPTGPRCEGLRAASLWCLGSGTTGQSVARVLSIAVLLLVASGYRPRWTCVPHWYVTFSLGAAVHVADGGLHVAKILTLLLVPICLGDHRAWQWRRPGAPLPPRWRGSAYAGHLAVRGQVALVYGQAVWSKLIEPEWRDGTAMHYVFQDPYFGAPPGLLDLAESGPFEVWLIPVITWGTVLVETVIALSAFGGRRLRRYALALGVVLHGAIGVSLGLVGFSLVMIGLLALSSAAPVTSSYPRQGAEPSVG